MFHKKKICLQIFNRYLSEVSNQKVKIFNPIYTEKEFPIYIFAIVKKKDRFIEYRKKIKFKLDPYLRHYLQQNIS